MAKFDEIVDTCKATKLNGSVDELTQWLKKNVASSNMNISIGSIKASTALAQNLKKAMNTGIKDLLGAILLKYKEKRPMILQEVDKFCDEMPAVANLEEMKDEIVPCIKNVAPGVKIGTLKFVDKIVTVTYIDVLKRCAEDYLTAIKATLDDKDGNVRETACHCMGTFKARVPEAMISKHIKDVVKQKLEKIDAAAGEVKPSKYDREENYKPPAAKKKKVVDEKEDTLMSFDDGPPKKAPPKNIGKKPEKKV